jgi:hypothetical protein
MATTGPTISPDIGDEKARARVPEAAVNVPLTVSHITTNVAVESEDHEDVKGEEDPEIEDLQLLTPLPPTKRDRRRGAGRVEPFFMSVQRTERKLNLLRKLQKLEAEEEEKEGLGLVPEGRRKSSGVHVAKGYPIVDHSGTPVAAARFVTEDEDDGAAQVPPPNLYPNPAAVGSIPSEPRAYSVGVDLTQWASLMEGQAMRPQPEKPPKFYDQPLIGMPNAVNKTDSKAQLTLKEWMDSMDVYFMLCGLKDIKVCFLFAMSMLGGVAKGVMEAAMRNPVILRVNSRNSDGDVVRVDLQPNNWGWLKETLRAHYHPAQRNMMVREQMRKLSQGPNEDVSSYYNRYQFFAGQLFMTDEESYGDFRAGLQEVYRLALNRVMQVRSGIPGAPETMSVTEALNIALQEEATLKFQSQQNRSRPYNWTSKFGGGRNRYRFTSNHGYGHGTAGKNGGSEHRQNNNNSQSQSNQPSALTAMESKGRRGEWKEEDEEDDEYEYEEDRGQLNAAMSSNSHPSRSGYVPSPAQWSSTSEGDKRRFRCWICNETGHFKSECPQRGRGTGTGQTGYGSRGRGRGGTAGNRGGAGGGNRGQGKV